MSALELCSVDEGESVHGLVTRVLRDGSGEVGEALVARYCKTLVSVDRELILSVLEHHQRLMGKAAAVSPRERGSRRADQVVRTALKPLYRRRAQRAPVRDLEVDGRGRSESPPVEFQTWLSERPETERLRDVSLNPAMLQAMAGWPMDWMDRVGVVCFERASSRVKLERGGAPDADFVRALVHVRRLPTALASASDHYLVVSPGRKIRWATVEETARSFGIEPQCPVMRPLVSTGPVEWLSAVQAVSCLGRGVHGGVARQLMATLMGRVELEGTLRYGSAFSGIDTFAAGVDMATSGDFEYVFASERDDKIREALLAGWSARGLDRVSVYSEACTGAALMAPRVDVWVCTPNCEAHSGSNRLRNHADQSVSLLSVYDALGYVRQRSPRIAIVENVNASSIVEPLTGMLARVSGYSLERGVLDPEGVVGAPVARTRVFWVLTRVDSTRLN